MANTDGIPKKYDGRKDWKDEHAARNQEVFLDYRSYAIPWRTNALKMENARYGRQFSQAEMNQLLVFRQAPLPISVSTAICDTADALMLSSNPVVNVSPIVYPYNDEKSQNSRAVANKFRHLIQKSWYDSLGGLQYDRATFDRSSVGNGFLYAIPRSEFGEFSVDVKHISWRYFFPDPSSIDPLYTDMDNMVYALHITNKSAYKFVQSIEPDLTYEQFKESWGTGSSSGYGSFEEDPVYRRPLKSSDYMLFIQRLTLERDTSYLIIPQSDEFRAGQGSLRYRTSTQMTPELKSLELQGHIKIKPVTRIFLTEYTSVGSLGYKIVYPISNYNIVPIQHDHRGTPYPYSLMWYLYPLQRALNKFIMSSVLNMALLNTTKVLAEENSIIDMNEWTTSASQPNAILQYRLPVPGVSKPPEIVKPTPMDNAFLVMPQYLTRMMEYVSGIYATMQGNPQDSPDVFSTVASLQSAGGQKIKRRQASADASLSKLGQVVGEFYKEYAPMNGFSSSFNEGTGEEEIIKFNELQSKVEMEKGKPKVRTTVNPESDLRQGFKQVRFTSTGSMGYESGTEAAMLTTLATQLKIPGLVPAILERINISGMDKVLENIDEVKNLQGENEQLQNITAELEKKNKQIEGQVRSLGIGLERARAKGQLDVELVKFQKDPMGYMEASMNNQGER
jgi:hypothetical protein